MSDSTALIAEPFHSLRRLERRAGRVGAACLVAALAIHAGVFQGAAWSALLGMGVRDAHAHPKPQTVELEVEPPPAPPAVIPEVSSDPPEERAPPPAPALAREFVPPAARAGAALTAAAEPEAEAKPDDDALVTGNNDTYAGGETDHDGTNDEASMGGRGAGAGPVVAPAPAVPAPPPAPPPPDLSRGAKCPLDVDWGCEHPNDSKDDKIVIVQIATFENGRVRDVKILASPGEAFSREAVRCSSRQKCLPALDRSGVAIPGETNPIRVRFIR